jgi:hypothetical protein
MRGHTKVPELPLQYENVLHMMFLCSTSHLLHTDRADRDLINAHQMYRVLALQGSSKIQLPT